MMHVTSACYCCNPIKPAAGMELDTALHELGMLSSVTESRRQYLQEKARRDSLEKSRMRNLSEPSLGSLVHATPTNSPTKQGSQGYQVLQINPQYVVSLSTSCFGKDSHSDHYNRDASERSTPSTMAETDLSSRAAAVSIGAKYSQENVEYQAKSCRIARCRLARLKRFRKPYEVPWHGMEKRYNISYPKPLPGPTLVMPQTARIPLSSEGNRSTNTPEKPLGELASVHRSRSLDELDFSKLQLAEAENHNFILEKKEIDTVSNNLQKLHVHE